MIEFTLNITLNRNKNGKKSRWLKKSMKKVDYG